MTLVTRSESVSVLRRLKQIFPHPGAMELGTPYRTVVGVILSARTRDEQVLKLLPGFFHEFPDFVSLAAASTASIAARINSIGMWRQKARHVQGMARAVVHDHCGRLPRTMDELVALPGVGRKTASVVLATCFLTPAIAVDTHVHRVTNRLGWVRTKTPAQTEQMLLGQIPLAWQKTVNRVFVKFGRWICLSGRPRCWMCPFVSQCRYNAKQLVAPRNAVEIRAAITRQEAELQRLRQTASRV